MSTGTNRTQLGEHNMRAVLHGLRRLGPSSQNEIAAEIGLSVQAVSVILRSLTDKGFVREVRSENVGRGRPRSIMGLVPYAAHAIGVHIDPALLTVVALDLTGNAVAVERSKAVSPTDAQETVVNAAHLAKRVRAELGTARDRVVGAAVAVPGRVDIGSGAIADSVWLPEWNHRPLTQWLTASLDVPVDLVKDTVAAVSGEIWVRGTELLERSTVFVYFGFGTGLGVAINGIAVTGDSGNAGQIGRLVEVIAGDHERTVTTAHDPAGLVRSAYREGIFAGQAPDDRQLARIDEDFRTLCGRAREGDVLARRLLETASTRVHKVASLVASLLDAEVIVRGGPYWPLLHDVLTTDSSHLSETSSPGRRDGACILSSCQGADAAAIGAASRVLEQNFSPAVAMSMA